jgi:septal ring factor EnvC (AmiA/AmiB activator)
MAAKRLLSELDNTKEKLTAEKEKLAAEKDQLTAKLLTEKDQSLAAKDELVAQKEIQLKLNTDIEVLKKSTERLYATTQRDVIGMPTSLLFFYSYHF